MASKKYVLKPKPNKVRLGAAEQVLLAKIGMISLAKMYAVVMLIMGVFIGLIYSLVLTPMLGAAALILIPIVPLLYGALGFVMGIITAGLYNWVAGWLGGVEFEVERKTK